MSDAYPPGTNDGDIERAFGDGETVENRWPSSGRLWEPAEGQGRGNPDDRFVVELVLADGVPIEDSRHPTLAQAQARRWLLGEEMRRRGHRTFATPIWDSEDPERGDLSAHEDDAHYFDYKAKRRKKDG